MKTNKPIDSKRIGNVEAAIWENPITDGVILNTSFGRTYTDPEGKPATAHSFAGSDLWRVVRVATWAYGRVRELEAERKADA